MIYLIILLTTTLLGFLWYYYNDELFKLSKMYKFGYLVILLQGIVTGLLVMIGPDSISHVTIAALTVGLYFTFPWVLILIANPDNLALKLFILIILSLLISCVLCWCKQYLG